MKKGERLSRWIVFGFLGIPLPLITYFYLILHEEFRVPYHNLAIPAVVFSIAVVFFAAGLSWGISARSHGDSRPIYFVVGLFLFLSLAEVKYFDFKIHAIPQNDQIFSYIGISAFVFFCTGLAYLVDRHLRRKSR